MRSNWFKLVMRLMHIQFGRNLALRGVPVMFNHNGAKLTLGSDVTINSSFLSNLVGLYSRTIIVTRTPEAMISIGNNVGISGATIYAREGISIGDRTLIGGNTKILDNDFHPIDPVSRFSNDIDRIGTRTITIGEDCFIGCNSLILKGTELGNGCVVGAGSVVSGKFPPRSVIVGNPGRVIRRLKDE